MYSQCTECVTVPVTVSASVGASGGVTGTDSVGASDGVQMVVQVRFGTCTKRNPVVFFNVFPAKAGLFFSREKSLKGA